MAYTAGFKLSFGGECLLLIFTLIITSHLSKANQGLEFLGEQPFQAFASRSTQLGKVLYQLFAVNSETGSSAGIRYRLLRSNSSTSRFSVVQDTGEIVLSHSYFPSLEGYSITVEASSETLGVTEHAGVTIAVITELQAAARFEHNEYDLQVSEDIPVSRTFSVINAFSLATTNLEYRESYSIAGGTSGSIFGMDQTNGLLSVKKQLDRERQSEYILIIDFSYGSKSIFTQVHIQVLDKNDNVPQFDRTIYNVSVCEDTPVSSTILTVTATDPDSGSGGSVLYTLSSSVEMQFSLNSTTGDLILSRPLDYESTMLYQFNVTAEDQGRPPLNSSVVIIINIVNVADECPIFQNSIFLSYHAAGTNGQLLRVVAHDPDRLGQVTYSIVSVTGDFDGDLSIDQNTGDISRQSGGTATGQYFLNVSASDANCVNMSFVSVEIRLGEMESTSPRFISDCVANLTENPTMGTEVVTMRAVDDDDGFYGRVTYSLTDNNYFAIDPSTGVVRTIHSPDSYDRERTPVLQVGVLARDGRLQQAYCLLNVTLLDENDNAPSFATPSYTAYLSNSASMGTFVVNVSAFDRDAGSNGDITYSLLLSSPFVINSTTGIITINGSLSASFYSLTAVAADGGNHSLSSSAQVSVTISAGSFPVFYQTYYNATVCETIFSSDVILMVEASNSPIYRLRNGLLYDSNSRSVFILQNDRNIVMGSNDVINYEALGPRKSFVFSVLAFNDRGTNMATIEIFVLDLDDNSPQESGIQSFSLAENQPPGTVLGKVIATDSDSGTYGDVAFELAMQSLQPDFSVSADGTITSVRVFDYDGAEQTSGILQVRAYNPNQFNETICSPSSGSAVIIPVLWTILDQNDEPPRFSMDSYTMIVSEEQDIGKSILIFNATDPDVVNANALHFSIVSGNDDGVFSINSTMLILRSKLNAQRMDDYTLVINVTDGIHYGSNCPRCTTTYHIRVAAGRDNTPPTFESLFYSAELAENAPEGMSVLSVSAEDPDSAAISYFLSTNVRSLFNISNSGDIFLVGPLDRETFANGVVSFLVFAQSGSISSAAINVTILDVNDCAPRFEDVYVSVVEENQAPQPGGTFVAQVQASDLDQGRNGTVSYQLEKGMEYGFEIDSHSGTITTNAMYDREKSPLYRLRVLATDQGSPDPLNSTTIVTVEIGDVNDNAPFFPFPCMFVRTFESSSSGTHIFDVLANDLDNGSNASITYSLVDASSDLFLLNETTGEITTAGSLDYELPFHRINWLVVSIRDRELSAEVTGNVTITLLDRNDNAPRLSSDVSYNFILGRNGSINENVPPNSLWATVHATDDDQGTNGELVYSLHGGNGDFEINDQGEIRTTRALDYESISSYNITVEIMDRGVPSNSLTFMLSFQVGDINDNAPSFGQSVYEVNVTENSPPQPSILRVQATDPDTGAGGRIDSYMIVSGNSGGVFSLNSTTGVLATISPLDREAVDRYTLVVSANDAGAESQTGTAQIIVTITDVDDNPTLGGGVMDVFLVSESGRLPVTSIAPIYFNDPDTSNRFTNCLRTFQTSDDFAVSRGNCTLRLDMPHPPSGGNYLVVSIFDSGVPVVDTTVNTDVSYIDRLVDSDLVTVTVNASATDYFSLRLNASLPNLIAQHLGAGAGAVVVVSVEPGYFDPKDSLDMTFSVRTSSGEFLSPLDITNSLYLARDSLFVNGRGIVSIPTDPCLAEPCSNQARCVITRTIGDSRLSISSRQSVLFSPQVTLGYQCDCVPGTAGTHCEVNYDDCYSNPCSYGVQCTDKVQGFMCDCPEGTFGPDCSFNPDECISNPCQNGATCNNEFNRFVCSCQPGYYGDACQYSYFKLSPVCGSNPCQNGGTCSPGRDSFTCLCPEGFDGPFCQEEVLIQGGCIGNPCYNGSSCTNVRDGHQCTCSVGFMGPNCKWPLNNCELAPCENGATCEQGFYGSYRCTCLPGYTGTNCSVRIAACESNPCENGGRCSDHSEGDNLFSCECSPPYTGPRCETNLLPMDYCAGSSCSGNCTSGSANYTCMCLEGFQGRDCTVRGTSFTNCSSNPCQYGGVCAIAPQRDSGYVCDCPVGYTGADCEIEIDDCNESNLCLNNGICIDGVGGYFCDCDPGTAGSNCQVYCPAGREGYFCEDVITYCNSTSCLNGGTCVEAIDGFLCTCPVTHMGSRCEFSSTCQTSNCANGGTCVNLEGGGSECSCPAGFEGKACELLSASFTGGQFINSYRAYPTLQHQGQERITFDFVTNHANGLLLFSTQYQAGQSLDFIVVEVVGGIVKVAMSYGSGNMSVSLTNDRVNDGRWHQLSIQRSGKSFSVLLDQCHVLDSGILSLSLCQSSASTPGRASFLNLGLPLWVGGVPFSSSDHSSSVGFSGCIRNFAIDGRFLDLETFVEQENSGIGCGQVYRGCELGKEAISNNVCGGGACIPMIGRYSCICPSQKTGENCEKSTESFMLTGEAYIQYQLKDTALAGARRKRQATSDMRLTLVDQFSFRFRTDRGNGTLFQLGRPSNDFAYVELAAEGLLVYHINLGSGEEIFTLSTTGVKARVDDAQWHFFESSRVALNLTLTLDNVTLSRTLGGDQLYMNVNPSDVYVGGSPLGGGASLYVGCMEDVRIDNRTLPVSGSNEVATVITSGIDDGQAGGGVSTGCSLRGCFVNPCRMGVCTELGDSDFQCSCDDGSVVQSTPCPDPVSMTRFRLLIIICSVVGGLVIALAIFVLIMLCWKAWYDRKYRKFTLRINPAPIDDVILSNRDYVDIGIIEEAEGGEEDTAMTGENWKRHMTGREGKNVENQSDYSSTSTIDKPVLDDEDEVIANTHMIGLQNGFETDHYPGSEPVHDEGYSPHQRARSPVISAFIDDRLESLKHLYKDLDHVAKYADEGTASPAISLKSKCSYRPEDEAYTVENLKNAGPDFVKFQVVLETLELEEENVAMDLESERVHTGQTQTQTEMGTQFSQSQNGFYF